MRTKSLNISIVLTFLTLLTACKKTSPPQDAAEAYRTLLIGKWTINQRGVDHNGNGNGEETEINALPPSLYSLFHFYDDATGMIYISDNSSNPPSDSTIIFTWNVPPESKSIQFLIDGRQEVMANILKLNKVSLVLEYENANGVKEWVYLTKP